MTIWEFNGMYGSLSDEQYFAKSVELSGKNFEMQQSISGYYRLLLDGKIYHDDSACEDVQEYESAINFYTELIVENFI